MLDHLLHDTTNLRETPWAGTIWSSTLSASGFMAPPAGSRRAINIAYKNGKLRINRFHTVKFDLPHRECRRFPRIIMTDYKLPREALYTLADNLAIIQKRLCASNGSIMVTCYQGQATVSMRRSRPDDGCS